MNTLPNAGPNPATSRAPISLRDVHIEDIQRGAEIEFLANLDGALHFQRLGYTIIPIVPGRKKPAAKYELWMHVPHDAITRHWKAHPEHEVGAILGENQLVLDTDTPQAQAALAEIEKRFGVTASFIVKTKRGFHHHYRLTEGTFAKPDSHDTEEYPDRIDVRAWRNSICLVPSKDKTIYRLDAKHVNEFNAVGQDFVDAIFLHNGRPVPRPVPDDVEFEPLETTTEIGKLTQLLNHIDPDCGYEDWLHVLMAVYHETGGSDEGLELAVSWSRNGKSYKDRADVETKWKSFEGSVSNPITVGTLIAMARDSGADTRSIMEERFQPCETEFVSVPAPEPKAKADPFRKFSISGQAAKYEAMAQATTPLLGDVCLKGESMAWYAKYNVGKTLLVLHLLFLAIEDGRIDPDKVYLINADDNSSGIATKLGLLDEFGVHMLVPGHNGFCIGKLEKLMLEAAQIGTARGLLIVIDTLKKFTDLMSKQQSSAFANVVRQFVSAGGTVLALGHVNKRKGDNGKSTYSGTSDILDDFDAGYIIDELPSTENPGEKLIEFTQEKSRGGGVRSVVYAYSDEEKISYAQRLSSVRKVDPEEVDGIKRAEQTRSDAETIAVITEQITKGVNTKMALRNATAEQADVSRNAAMKVIEHYTGDDPTQHRWSFTRGAHNAQVYRLLTDS